MLYAFSDLMLLAEWQEVEHSNSGKKSFDSILATESIFSIRFDLPIW